MAKRRDLITVPMTVPWNTKPNRKYFLRHLIEKNNFTTMAEVGVRDGRTTFYLLDKCPDLIIYGIDLDTSKFFTSAVKEKYGDRLVPIQGYSDQVANKIPQVDLVFIDADHGYEGCKKDIIAYTPQVKQNGLLTGHDIDYPGVNKAVRELVKKFDVGPNNVWIKST